MEKVAALRGEENFAGLADSVRRNIGGGRRLSSREIKLSGRTADALFCRNSRNRKSNRNRNEGGCTSR